MSNPIEQAKEAVKQNSYAFNRALDRARHRRNLSEEDRRAIIYAGFQDARQKHRELIQALRETKRQYRTQLEEAIFRPNRPSNYNGLANRPLELMAIRDATARARAAEDAGVLGSMLEDALAVGDSYMSHAIFVESNKRAPQDATLSGITTSEGVMDGPHVQLMRRFLETDPTRAAQYQEWVSLGSENEVAGDVLEIFEMQGPREPAEIRGYVPPVSEENQNPFEQESPRQGVARETTENRVLDAGDGVQVIDKETVSRGYGMTTGSGYG